MPRHKKHLPFREMSYILMEEIEKLETRLNIYVNMSTGRFLTRTEDFMQFYKFYCQTKRHCAPYTHEAGEDDILIHICTGRLRDMLPKFAWLGDKLVAHLHEQWKVRTPNHEDFAWLYTLYERSGSERWYQVREHMGLGEEYEPGEKAPRQLSEVENENFEEWRAIHNARPIVKFVFRGWEWLVRGNTREERNAAGDKRLSYNEGVDELWTTLENPLWNHRPRNL